VQLGHQADLRVPAACQVELLSHARLWLYAPAGPALLRGCVSRSPPCQGLRRRPFARA
jgi:hypothetical protein